MFVEKKKSVDRRAEVVKVGIKSFQTSKAIKKEQPAEKQSLKRFKKK
jgi:hypothetical protein